MVSLLRSWQSKLDTPGNQRRTSSTSFYTPEELRKRAKRWTLFCQSVERESKSCKLRSFSDTHTFLNYSDEFLSDVADTSGNEHLTNQTMDKSDMRCDKKLNKTGSNEHKLLTQYSVEQASTETKQNYTASKTVENESSSDTREETVSSPQSVQQAFKETRQNRKQDVITEASTKNRRLYNSEEKLNTQSIVETTTPNNTRNRAFNDSNMISDEKLNKTRLEVCRSAVKRSTKKKQIKNHGVAKKNSERILRSGSREHQVLSKRSVEQAPTKNEHNDIAKKKSLERKPGSDTHEEKVSSLQSVQQAPTKKRRSNIITDIHEHDIQKNLIITKHSEKASTAALKSKSCQEKYKISEVDISSQKHSKAESQNHTTSSGNNHTKRSEQLFPVKSSTMKELSVSLCRTTHIHATGQSEGASTEAYKSRTRSAKSQFSEIEKDISAELTIDVQNSTTAPEENEPSRSVEKASGEKHEANKFTDNYEQLIQAKGNTTEKSNTTLAKALKSRRSHGRTNILKIEIVSPKCVKSESSKTSSTMKVLSNSICQKAEKTPGSNNYERKARIRSNVYATRRSKQASAEAKLDKGNHENLAIVVGNSMTAFESNIRSQNVEKAPAKNDEANITTRNYKQDIQANVNTTEHSKGSSAGALKSKTSHGKSRILRVEIGSRKYAKAEQNSKTSSTVKLLSNSSCQKIDEAIEQKMSNYYAGKAKVRTNFHATKRSKRVLAEAYESKARNVKSKFPRLETDNCGCPKIDVQSTTIPSEDIPPSQSYPNVLETFIEQTQGGVKDVGTEMPEEGRHSKSSCMDSSCQTDDSNVFDNLADQNSVSLKDVLEVVIRRNESKILQDGHFDEWSHLLVLLCQKCPFEAEVIIAFIKEHMTMENIEAIRKNIEINFKSSLGDLLQARKARDEFLHCSIEKEWRRLTHSMPLKEVILYSRYVLNMSHEI